MVTITNLVAQYVSHLTKTRTHVFNDKLVDGRRSLKVFGWKEEYYDVAAILLRAAGCKVDKIVLPGNPKHNGYYRAATRLHIAEPTTTAKNFSELNISLELLLELEVKYG